MKKITLFSILAAFVAVLSFSSCNSSDSNGYTPLTSQEKAKCFQALDLFSMTSPTGDFTYYCKKGANNYVSDSTITASWSIDRIGNDSVITIQVNDPNNGIAKGLADYLPDYTNGKSNSGLKEALKNYKGAAKFTCPITIWYQQNPITFILGGKNLTYNLEYDGASHKVDFIFSYTSGYNYTNSGIYQPSNTKNAVQMSIRLMLYGFKVDKTDNDSSEPTRLELPTSNGTVNYTWYIFNVK